VAFGDTVITIPDNRAFFVMSYDLGPELGNYRVEIDAGLDVMTGIARWHLRTVDPQTGELPEDPMAGFLPPNDDTHRGEGYVAFTVRPEADLPTGTIITSAAEIVFDNNEPILTNEAWNTIDGVAPESSVASLPPEVEGTSVQVSWSGSDDPGGAGVAAYQVYVSENGGAYEIWLSSQTAGSEDFSGDSGSTYRFYSIATDNAGNVEAPPAEADALTTFWASAPVLEVSTNSLDFGTVSVGASEDRSFTVRNAGADELTGDAGGLSVPFTFVGDTAFTLGKGEEIGITVRFSPSESGDVSQTVMLASNGGDGTVAVSGTGACPDLDGDGYSTAGGVCGQVDCDDSNAAVNPGMVEGPPFDPTCSDTLDNDCDGDVDSADSRCPVVSMADVDCDGVVMIDTDLVFMYRCMVGIQAVPPFYREYGTFPPDEQICADVGYRESFYDVDESGETQIDTDLVFFYRCMVGLPAVPTWYRDLTEFPPDELICANVQALCETAGGGGSALGRASVQNSKSGAGVQTLESGGDNLLTLGCLEPEPGGDRFMAPIFLDADRDLTRLSFSVKYDPSVLQPVEVRKTGRTVKDPDEGGIDPGSGTIRISLFDLSGTTMIPPGNERILEVVFVRKTEGGSDGLEVIGLEARHGPMAVEIVTKQCKTPNEGWGPSQTASLDGVRMVNESFLLNLLAVILIPMGAVILLRLPRRRQGNSRPAI